MFTTLAHKQRCLAKAQAIVNNAQGIAAKVLAAPAQIPVNLRNQQGVINAALEQDLSALHQIKDVSQKAELKKTQLIPKWQATIDEYLESGAKHLFEPLVRFVIWLLDSDQIDKAIAYADRAIAQQMPMPSGFSRSLAAFVVETIHDWAQRQFKAGHSAEPYLSDVILRVESKAWLVIEPIILNKLYKLVGLFARQDGELQKAEYFFKKCIEVNPEKHGVKTLLAQVQEKLNPTA